MTHINPCASKIDKLTPKLRKALESFLGDPNISQAEAARRLNEMAGEKAVSPSAVNRYAIKTRRFREKTLQAQKIAEVWVKELGNDESSKLGRILQEQLRTLVFDIAIDAEEQEGEERIKAVRTVAATLRDLEHAANANQERERKLTQMIEARVTKEKAEQVAGEATKLGLPTDQVALLRKAVMG